MIEENIEYVGSCKCNRRAIVVEHKGNVSKRATKVICGGRLYKITKTIKVDDSDPIVTKVLWCRNRHFRFEEIYEETNNE